MRGTNSHVENHRTNTHAMPPSQRHRAGWWLLTAITILHILCIVNIIGRQEFMTPGDGRSVFGWPFEYTDADLTSIQLNHYHHFCESGKFFTTPGPSVWSASSLQAVRMPEVCANASLALLIAIVGCADVTQRGNTRNGYRLATTLHLLCVMSFLAVFTATWQSTIVGTLYLHHPHLVVAASLASSVILLRCMQLHDMNRVSVPERNVISLYGC